MHSLTWLTLPGAEPAASINMVWIESITTTSGRTSRITSAIVSRFVSLKNESGPHTVPIRLARSLICFNDSSPETYKTFCSCPARFRQTCRSRVDFPIPGSPPTSTREPRTTPLPSTRSSSANPVLVRSVSESSISSKLTGFACAPARFPGAAVSEAAAAYRPAAVPDDAGADGASTIVFHALHAGHCPIHLEDS